MATDNSSSPPCSGPQSANPSAAPSDPADIPGPLGPLFQPFQDFPPAFDRLPIPGHLLASFASTVRRMAGGCQVLVALLEQEVVDDRDRDVGDPHAQPPILGGFERGQLYLLVTACLESLVQRSAQLADHAHDLCAQQGEARRNAAQGTGSAQPFEEATAELPVTAGV